jgi:hypothetical protein
MKILSAACLCLLSATTAYGEICTFTSECFEDESCAETAFSITIDGASLITDAETIPVSKGGSEKLSVFVGYTDSAFHVLTRETTGGARYSTHIFDGPLMVNYLGTCN